MNGFVGKTRFDTEAKGNSKMAYYNSLQTLEITPNFLLSVGSERRWGPNRVKKIDLDAILTGRARQSLRDYSTYIHTYFIRFSKKGFSKPITI